MAIYTGMNFMNITDIIAKKIKDNLTVQEQAYFDQWMDRSEENRSLYSRLHRILKEQGEQEFLRILELDEEMAWNRVLETSKVRKGQDNKRIALPSLLKYAAILIVALGLGIGIWNHDQPISEQLQPENAITLQLDNGEVKVIPAEALQTLVNSKGGILSKQNGSRLDYSVSNETKELAYNVLKVPYGKTFTIVLSDSTIVYLNAGSSLKYPVKFFDDQNRQVFLTGEGYFDVHKDKKHPFIVTSGDMDVRVLGTKFNISAYPEDGEISTVLVEGSVGLYDSGEEYNEKTVALLQPGYKAEWDKFYKKLAFEKVDTDIYTNWIEGKLVLKQMPFKSIVKKLERKYNVSIESNYNKLDHQVFTATFDVEPIQEVLKTFTEETPFKFEIDGNHVTISEP